MTQALGSDSPEKMGGAAPSKRPMWCISSAGHASACLLLLLVALPPAAPSCPMLCTCYSSPPTVSCQANNFSSVPLSLPPSTQRLFLQNNLIRTLRPGTFGPSLLTLWLFSNNLSTIYPGTFRRLQALEELDLGDNPHLRSLEPDTFHGLERLQSLHLYRCQLSSLPGNIFRGLVSLQYLYLQENSLLHLQVRPLIPQYMNLAPLPGSLFSALTSPAHPLALFLSFLFSVLPGFGVVPGAGLSLSFQTALPYISLVSLPVLCRPPLPLSLTCLPHLSSPASSVCLPSHARSTHTPMSVWV